MHRILILAALAVPVFAQAESDAAFFTAKVKPVLDRSCIGCHGPDKQKSHLRLDSRAAILTGGKGGPAAVPGKPDDSLLIKAITYQDEDLQMPPKGKKLSAEQIAALTEWVTRGLPWPEGADKPAGEDDHPKQAAPGAKPK